MIYSNSWEFWTIFFATVAVVIMKFSIVVYLAVKIRVRKKEGSLAVPFIRGFMLLILFLLISRVLFMIFDFYYTQFNMALYSNHPGVWFWQAGMFISSIGLAIIVFVTDKQLINFKFKGLFAYIVLAGGIFELVYPVNNLNDFNFLSTISILPDISLLVTFLCLVNIAWKTTGTVRRNAGILILAIVFYTISALVVNSGLITALNAILGFDVDVYFYLLQAILKITSIGLMAWGASHWM